MKYYLDTRSVGKDGRCPLRLRMSKEGRYGMPLTGIRINPHEWDSMNCRAKDPRLNMRLRDLQDTAEDYILRLKADGQYADMTLEQLVNEISRRVLSGKVRLNKKETLIFRMEQYRDRLTKPGTRNVYDRTIATLRNFDEDIELRKFKDVDSDYLYRLERWCSDKGMKINTISILMRNIRTVFNDARDDEITSCYPFRKYKIKSESTMKRSMTIEDLGEFVSCKVNSDQQKYKDYFMLMIYLIGINSTDLFNAKPEDLDKGRLNYRRDKTGKLYSIKVEPEAMSIIKKYRGKRYLLEAMDGHEQFLSWRNQFNRRLKAIGRPTGKKGKILGDGPFKGISTYWARHTWATLAYRIGIPVDIIGQALGHSDRAHAVTYTYINTDTSKVDDANRRVIDFIMDHIAYFPPPQPQPSIQMTSTRTSAVSPAM